MITSMTPIAPCITVLSGNANKVGEMTFRSGRIGKEWRWWKEEMFFSSVMISIHLLPIIGCF